MELKQFYAVLHAELQWISNSSTLSYTQSYVYDLQTRICHMQTYVYVPQPRIRYTQTRIFQMQTYVYVPQNHICYP